MTASLILSISGFVIFISIAFYNYHLRQLIQVHELTIESKYHIISALQDYVSKLEEKNADLVDENNSLKTKKSATRKKSN